MLECMANLNQMLGFTHKTSLCETADTVHVYGFGCAGEVCFVVFTLFVQFQKMS